MEDPRRWREVGQPRGVAKLAGVLLHGRGRTPTEKIDLAARLAHLESIRWLVPTADAGSWYPNRFMDPIGLNEPFLSQAVEQCHEAVSEASEQGRLGPEHIAVIGFSQGACVAIEYVLRHPGCCANLIAFTGAIMGLHDRKWIASVESLTGLRVLITGSDVDEWIPERSTRDTARVLGELGASVTMRIYSGRPHIVNEEEIEEARSLLESRL